MSRGPGPGSIRRTATGPPGHPEAVERFAGILADWLASYTIAAPLAAEMADAMEAGSAWVGAIGAGAVRRAGWPDTESAAWGIAVSALAAAHVAAIRSLDGEPRTRDPGSGADGPARALLASDGLVAAGHETLASLSPGRLATAFAALEQAYGDGGPWRLLPVEAASEGPRTRAWPRLVPLALGPASIERPDGPWADLAAAWERFGDGRPGGEGSDPETPAERALYEHRSADGSTMALLRAAAEAARQSGREDPRGGA